MGEIVDGRAADGADGVVVVRAQCARHTGTPAH